ncbi:MAG: Asp-tRNA(Asn)/Glu-tRNA(Gln) amidotransferase subunit GatA [Ferruginibacter sp.]
MFSFTNIAAYQNDLQKGSVTCVQAVTHYLAEIEKNKRLNAFTEVFGTEALEKAALLDERRKSGQPLKKLHGVVIAIKDVICYKGHKVTAASAILKDFESLYTASALQYLLDEDAIVIGACNCDEFAMGSSNENSVYGKVLNAADETRVPGGSSGGSAVAVQAGMCMLSLGSDTGGSVRQPADFCGIIGLKPTYGRISRYGLIAYASSFDQLGIFGYALEDVALLLSIMSKPDEMDSTMLQKAPEAYENFKQTEDKNFRICYLKETLEHAGLDPEIKQQSLQFFEALRTAGHSVEAASFDLLDYIVPTYYVLTTAEASSNLGRYDGIRYGHRSNRPAENLEDFYRNNRSEGFGTEVKRRIMLGTFVLSTGYYDAYFSKAQKIRRLLVEKINDLFSRYDAVLMPVSPTTAFKTGANDKDPVAMYLADIYTVFANLTGIPGIALPLFSHSNNLPFGLQVMTNKGNELVLLQVSEELFKLKKP